MTYILRHLVYTILPYFLVFGYRISCRIYFINSAIHIEDSTTIFRSVPGGSFAASGLEVAGAHSG